MRFRISRWEHLIAFVVKSHVQLIRHAISSQSHAETNEFTHKKAIDRLFDLYTF